MSGVIACLLVDWDCLMESNRDHQGLSAKLVHLAREANFHLTDDTKWAHAKVHTFLEDGWKAQQSWTTLHPNCGVDLEVFGQLANTMLAGSRTEKVMAADIGARWTGEGPWPTQLDRAALLFFVACES